MQKTASSTRPIRCPECRARLAAETTRCACGYVAASAPGAEGGVENLVIKAERLYENYLSARVMRARKAVIDMRARRLQNVRDEALLHQLRTAEKELRALEMQLIAQNAKADEAKAGADAITEPLATPPTADENHASAVKPTMRFRANQATRAAAVPKRKSDDSFTAAQAKRARLALQGSDPSLKVCPECEATLSPSAPQCICGYNFRLARRQPDFLSDEEIRALRGQ